MKKSPAPTIGSAPYFAVMRELARVSRACLQQTAINWPLNIGKSLVFDTGLEGVWNKARWSDHFNQYFHGLEAQLGPAYRPLIDPLRDSLGNAHTLSEPIAFGEIMKCLDDCNPDWNHDWIVEAEPLESTTLYQSHIGIDEQSKRWVLKVVKPTAKDQLQSTLYALREIELVLKPFRSIPVASRMLVQLADMRRSFHRQYDLLIERRVLLRLKSTQDSDRKPMLRFPKIHDYYGNENILVYESLEGLSMGQLGALQNSLALKKYSLTHQALQASVLKAFELGLIRELADIDRLIIMKDGAVAVRQGWANIVSDGADRVQAAQVIRALSNNDFVKLGEVLAQASSRFAAQRHPLNDSDYLEQCMAELGREAHRYTLKELAEFTLSYCQTLGIDLPCGFIDIAKYLQALEGVGTPKLAKSGVKKTSTLAGKSAIKEFIWTRIFCAHAVCTSGDGLAREAMKLAFYMSLSAICSLVGTTLLAVEALPPGAYIPEPLLMRSESISQLFRSSPILQRLKLGEEGDWRIGLTRAYSNFWGHDKRYIVDLETRDDQLRVYYQPFKQVEFYGMASERAFTHLGTDGLAIGFHNFFGLPQDGRLSAKRNNLRLSIPDFNLNYSLAEQNNVLSRQIEIGGVWDIGELYQLEWPVTLALFGTRETAEGNPYFTSATDGGMRLSLALPSPSATLFASLSLAIFDRTLEPDLSTYNQQWGGVIGGAYRWAQNHETVLQFLVYQPLFQDMGQLSRNSYEVHLAYRYKWDKISLELGLIENVFWVYNSPDWGFSVGLGYAP